MKTAIVLAIAMALAAGPLHAQDAAQPPPTPPQEQPEVLTRGPMHEAFAGPVDLQVQKGLVAPTEPPPDIVENPPAERPAGHQYVWVPGYWGWDAERNGYIWISGCWRAAPPNRYWVPGYWYRTDEGWEWVPGFWAPVANVEQIEYLPAPPSIEDVQPPGPPPMPDNIWVPPCWYWYQSRYVWRPGYWVVAQPEWVWAPSHYVWTPRGYVFVVGHWDHSIPRRGVLFAPIYIPRPVYMQVGFSYSLSVVVDLGMFQFSLFTHPRYSHYYYGDYHDDVYVRLGIFPRYECRKHHTWYDPIYEHDRWHHVRVEPEWDRHERREYERRRVEPELRPPRTYREMEARQSRMPEARRGEIQVAAPLSRVASDKQSPVKFKQVKDTARQKLSTEATEVRTFGAERRQWESVSAGAPRTAEPARERKTSVTVPQSPERAESESRQRERKSQAPPSAERREPTGTPAAERKPTYVPPRDAGPSRPEQVKIPDPPIVNRERGLGIFRKGPPSRPDAEQRTESRSASGNGDRGRSSEKSRERR
ncbi:MAG: hypothetical protein AB1640_23255 [bacterium]